MLFKVLRLCGFTLCLGFSRAFVVQGSAIVWLQVVIAALRCSMCQVCVAVTCFSSVFSIAISLCMCCAMLLFCVDVICVRVCLQRCVVQGV